MLAAHEVAGTGDSMNLCPKGKLFGEPMPIFEAIALVKAAFGISNDGREGLALENGAGEEQDAGPVVRPYHVDRIEVGGVGGLVGNQEGFRLKDDLVFCMENQFRNGRFFRVLVASGKPVFAVEVVAIDEGNVLSASLAASFFTSESRVAVIDFDDALLPFGESLDIAAGSFVTAIQDQQDFAGDAVLLRMFDRDVHTTQGSMDQ